MILIPIFAFAIGILIGNIVFQGTPISGDAGIYLGVGVIAALDSILGGVKSALAGEFRSDVFLTGFLVNMVAAGFFAWFGDQIGVNLYLAAVLAMGWRIFNNLGLIRRQLLAAYLAGMRQRAVDRGEA
ncbi:MAG: small basic family protein [Fimbriimonadaceae bacterium]|nr:small basic family protein [Fimbriimonadaceae bacterium]